VEQLGSFRDRQMITEDMDIEDIVRDYPVVIDPLSKYGIVCVACGEPIWGTLRELADPIGINNLAPIMEQMNKLIREKSALK